ARVHARRPTGGAVELLFVEPAAAADGTGGPVPSASLSGGSGYAVAGTWRCLARARRPLRAGAELAVGPHTVTVVETRTAGDRDDTAITVYVPIPEPHFL